MMLGPSLHDRILELTRWSVVLGIVAAALVVWSLDFALRRRWTPSRHRLMRGQLIALGNAVAVALALWLAEQLLVRAHAPAGLVIGVGFVAIVAWLHAGLRVVRVAVLEWLFAHSEREGVPLLLVDVIMLVGAVALLAALLHAVFRIEVTSLLATSAVVSVVLGLALQDTLGQLFAGISLQLDRAFRLGDWIEVRSGAEHVTGQVLEMSWRSTVLVAIGDEQITIPNKTITQGVVLNFSGRERPFVRSHLFRIGLDADIALAKRLLLDAARTTPGIVAEPAPIPLLIETTDSWITLKMINFVTDFGSQYSIGDAFQTRALALFDAHGIALAAPRLHVASTPTSTRA